ncbi:hypothetical protein M422DRAFT_191987 [Sphaerobolus stellatus SS14]|uniref:CxC2-like cysteine cluster KDZ transposase-associated domain-containing protein n=1 Tax=Sphaerobolus stellatus (strain SS14) TaxID=990650 RepID=A0A0C9UMU3_SPHS4|nr:hypothetical protein M422DRAFT_191987 [Sphaerobolus stellatus SS14]
MAEGSYKCTDCDHEGLWCQACLVRVHQWPPFHHARKWDNHTLQLFNRKLFPASLLRPRMAFTFRLLKLFHMLNHVGRPTL